MSYQDEFIKTTAQEVVSDLAKAAKTFNINRTSKFYRGRRLNNLGHIFRKTATENPHLFPLLSSEERADEISKFFVDLAIKATLAEGSTGAGTGGSLVPEEWGELFQIARDTSVALQFCTIFNMHNQIMNIPKELTLASVNWVDEEAEETESIPSFGTIKLTAKNLSAFAVCSTELLRDASVDIASMLAEQFAYAIGQELDNEVLNGDGTRVSGVLTAAAGYSVILSGTSFSTVTAVNLSSTIFKLEEGFRREARFILNRMAEHYCHGLSDDTKSPCWTPGYVASSEARLYGYPITIAEKISTTDGTGKEFGVFGNFRKFIIGRHLRSLPIDIDPWGLVSTHQTRFRLIQAFDFNIGNNLAFCRIINA